MVDRAIEAPRLVVQRLPIVIYRIESRPYRPDLDDSSCSVQLKAHNSEPQNSFSRTILVDQLLICQQKKK